MRGMFLSWPSAAGQFSGRWLALENCRYDGATNQPVEGNVVDSDEDLAELCARLHEASRSKCIILYCDEELIIEPHHHVGKDGGFEARIHP